jgi:hypothetical protein
MTKHDPAGSSPIPLVPLLITESEEEFKRIRQALYEELGPVGIIEQMYVDEFADIVWEILRSKRCKAGVTNLKFHDESARLLGRLINVGPDIARDWISDPDIAKEVEKRLAEYKLDGSVVIADAIQAASYKLELIEALIVSAEKRRDTALARLTQYRGELGIILRRASDRLIESKVVELPRPAQKKSRRRQRSDGKVVELGGAANTKDGDGIDGAVNARDGDCIDGAANARDGDGIGHAGETKKDSAA